MYTVGEAKQKYWPIGMPLEQTAEFYRLVVRGRVPVRSIDSMTEEMYEAQPTKKHPLDEVQGL